AARTLAARSSGLFGVAQHAAAPAQDQTSPLVTSALNSASGQPRSEVSLRSAGASTGVSRRDMVPGCPNIASAITAGNEPWKAFGPPILWMRGPNAESG